ncbi:hypothetical protein [Vibrio phage phiKT1028]|nr:hypothetical protein [Vibrio phage phiKT1028]
MIVTPLEDGWIRSIAIDPSTMRMGVSVLDVNLAETEKFKLQWVETIHGEKLEHFDSVNYADDNAVQSRMHGLSKSYRQLLEFFKPTIAACEDNFLGRSPDTFKRLIEVVSLLRMQTESYGNGLYMVNVPPRAAKETVGANFKGTQKEDVTKGIKKYQSIDLNGYDLDVLDEHSIDAIAINLNVCERIAKDRGKFYDNVKS